MERIAAEIWRDDVLYAALQRRLNDIDLETRRGRVEGLDDGILASERGLEGRDGLNFGGLDGDGGGEVVSRGGVLCKGLARPHSHGEAGGNKGGNDGPADAAGCLHRVMGCQ